jgi:hypothetical protein
MSVSAREKQDMMTSAGWEMNKALKIYWIIFYYGHRVISLITILVKKEEKLME